LWAGDLTRRFAGSELVRTVRATAEAVLAGWPELLPAQPEPTGVGTRVDHEGPAHGAVTESTGTVMEGTRS
jgi:hypothetical protein